MTAKLWGGRFSGKKMDPDVMKFTSSLDIDKELALYDCLSSKVHAEMLYKSGLLTGEEKKELFKALEDVCSAIQKGALQFEGREDIHSVIQDMVEKAAPESSKKLHTGRSRNEQVVNDLRLYCKDKISFIQELIRRLQKEITGLAWRTLGFIVPGYTHLNRAQPVLFSHLLMAYVEMLQRDAERLADAGKRCDVSVMGSGALAGSSLKLDRVFVSGKLGFKAVSANSIDSVSDRDFVLEIVAGLSSIALHLSRISEDLILYSTPEFGFIDIGEDYCTGSSLMPQKKNPDVLELVRGKSSHVIGALTSLAVLLKGLPHTYNRDLQEDKKPLFESVRLISQELGIMAGLVGTVKTRENAAEKALEDEFLYATDLAEYLVRAGVPFKDAHDAVGGIIKYCSDKDINVSDLSISELKGFSDKFGEDVYGLLNAAASVANKKTPGSTNPELVRKTVSAWKKKLA